MGRRSPLVVLLLIVAVLAIWSISSYNGLVTKSESVTSTRQQIEVQLQRRLDLIPNLVNTVKGYAAHEKSTFQAVADARSKLAGATSIGDKAAANQELSNALSRLLVLVERYPALKADRGFVQLQDQLEGTENRIAVARKDYNDVVQDYNKTIRRFPTVIFASMFGFEKEDYFNASNAAAEPPSVDFNE